MAKLVFILLLIVVIQLCNAAFTVEHVNFIQADILIFYTNTFITFLLFTIQNGNTLFRGGIPNSDGKFQYDTLISEMKTIAKEQGGLTLPDIFYLIDIKYDLSFLNTYNLIQNTYVLFIK
jgi:hypothetical protein